MARWPKLAFALLGIALLSTGCRKTPPPPAAAPQNGPVAVAAPAPAPAPAVDPDAARRAEEQRVREVLEQRVHFDFDDSSIRADSRQLLDQKVPLLRQHQGLSLSIEGHADERGSTEYNLALGTRRAVSVMEYLVGFGLDAQRFRTFSYGEERPLVQGRSEAAWAQNRRAEFRVNGSIAETLPR